MNELNEKEQASLEELLVPPETSNPDEGTDSVAEQEAPEGQGEGQSNYYSSEEFEEILTRNPLDVDPSMVPPELMPAYKTALKAYKSFQADYTRKTQEIAQKKQEQKPKDIYEAYDADPEGVTAYIDAKIVEAKEAGDIDQVTMLLNIKSNLVERRIRKIESMTVQEKQFQDIFSEVRREIPDIEKKAPILTEFAIKQLGFSEEEIEKLTDPAITGRLAAKITLAVNKIYNYFNADKNLVKKEVKSQPNRTVPAAGRVETESQGGVLGYKPGEIGKLSWEEFEKVLRKAKNQPF